jgi:prepilin-type N-terminal cleavage/methylation domain-containing protein
MTAPRPCSRARRAFTIIELIVVVVIVALLSAIALSHMQAAQLRTRTTEAKANIREVLNALDVYRLDYNEYPRARPVADKDPFGVLADTQLAVLAAPVSYLSRAAFRDPFAQGGLNLRLPYGPMLMQTPLDLANAGSSMMYIDYQAYPRLAKLPQLEMAAVSIISIGPDRQDTLGALRVLPAASFGPYRSSGLRNPVDTEYDPTNGLTSAGDIIGLTGEVALRRIAD